MEKMFSRFLKKLNIELPCKSAILLLEIYPKESKTGTYICIAALYTITKKLNEPKCPSTDESIIELWKVHTMVLT